VSAFITDQVQNCGLATKTANRHREILHRLFTWAMDEGGIRLPNDNNPVAKVARDKERAPEIRFLMLARIDEQLTALAKRPQIQTMVAVLIYAGLPREELLWLHLDDIDYKTGRHGMIRVRAKAVAGESWQRKTKVNRAVPISPSLGGYFAKYRPKIVPGQ
jgi:integrase